MKKFFDNVKKYQKYAKRSAMAELRSEVADSYLNWLWWIIEPLCFMLIYSFIFGVVFKSKTGNFICFVFVGLLTWDFFNRMITGSVRLIANNREIVKKVYLPKYILLLSKSYTYLFKMGISLCIAFLLMAYQRVHFGLTMLYAIPLIAELYIISFGFGLILMHFGVTINDLGNLIKILLRMVFYLSGVFFDITDRLSGAACFILLKVNPVALIMCDMRNVLIYEKTPHFRTLGVWLIIGLALCTIGIKLIHKYENSYAKVI